MGHAFCGLSETAKNTGFPVTLFAMKTLSGFLSLAQRVKTDRLLEGLKTPHSGAQASG